MDILQNSESEEIITNKDRKFITSSISKLSASEHVEIFKIISNSTNKYSENNNGIFINLSKIPDKVNLEIIEFIKYCLNNKKLLDSQSKERDYISEIVNSTENVDNENNYTDSSKGSDSEEITTDNNFSDCFNNIEKEIVNPSLNIDETSEFEKKPKYKGNRAKIIKKCKEDKFNNEDNLEEL